MLPHSLFLEPKHKPEIKRWHHKTNALQAGFTNAHVWRMRGAKYASAVHAPVSLTPEVVHVVELAYV